MIVKLLTEHHFEFLSLKEGCIGLSESTLVNATFLEITTLVGSYLVSYYMPLCMPLCGLKIRN